MCFDHILRARSEAEDAAVSGHTVLISRVMFIINIFLQLACPLHLLLFLRRKQRTCQNSRMPAFLQSPHTNILAQAVGWWLEKLNPEIAFDLQKSSLVLSSKDN